ncbi:hypothetical protein NQ317_001524 [Molorchus minor]|uniref:C2H2-type domain-containing protein n=1 Tax=Molorchus minor TaxID=1323400 RepID=A0ABQ9J3I5_9CUCU|nr:hypothetical protein NQ317_001524 [Molorchus minor]
MEKFIIAKDFVKKVRRFSVKGRTIEFKIKPVPSNEEPVSWIKEAVNQVIHKGTQDLGPDDQVAFSFCSKDFKRGDGWVRFRPVANVTYDDVWDVISNVYQSNSTGLNTDTFCLGVTSVKMPIGKGNDNRARQYNNFGEECSKRRGIILQRAEKLVEDAGVSIPEEGCGIPELQKFQDHLLNYRIVVYNYGSKGRDVIFRSSNEATALNLIYHRGHYNVITSLTAAFACSYFCEECHVPYNTKTAHRCCKTCPCCYQAPVGPHAISVRCDDCNRSFRGQSCYDNHLKPRSHGKSIVCAQVIRCENCLKMLKSDRKHVCNEVYCKICQDHVPQDHMCFMQPDTRSPKINETLFIFYDLETRQERVLADGSVLHEPNLCVLTRKSYTFAKNVGTD